MPWKKDKREAMLAERIVPLVERDGKLFRVVVESIHHAFTWSEDIREEVTNLEPICEVRTHHSYAAPVFFKPTVYEVLNQMPKRIEDEAVAFLVRGPNDADDLNRERSAFMEGYHIGKTTFYRKRVE